MNNNYNIPDYIPGGAMVGVILVLILLAILVYVKPSYFKFLFKSFLGNLIVAFIVIVISVMDIKWGIGVAAVAVIVYQAFQISCVEVEGFKSSTCKPGCAAPTEPVGNCKVSKDKKTVLCPWECTSDPNNYQFNSDGSTVNCIYSSECTSCGAPVKFDNPVVPSTACFSSEFGCCSDGDTAKADPSGSNCPADEEPDSACSISKYGCCPDGKTAAVETEGSNCSNSGSGSGSNPWDNSDIFQKDSKHKDSKKKPSGVSSVRGLFPEGYPVPKNLIWPENIIADFIKFQKIHNPNLRFDLDIIQKQANVSEVQELLKHGKWPWSSAVQEMYKRAIQENNIINTEPGASMNNAQTVYNQTAILELLSWNSKEGSFLINGAVIGHNDDMPENINNLVRCGTSNSGSGDISMYKIEYTGYNGIYGNMNSKVTPVNNADLPSVLNGFKFLGSECNPCVALNNPADYSCHFSLNTGNGAEVSSVWQKLWGVNAQGVPVPNSDSKSKLKPDSVTSTFNKKEFPILNQLKDEIMRGASLVDVSFKKPPTMDSFSNAQISSVTGSSVPAILSNESHDQNAVYYGTKNSF